MALKQDVFILETGSENYHSLIVTQVLIPILTTLWPAGSHRVVLGTVVAASPGNLLEMQIHGPTPD